VSDRIGLADTMTVMTRDPRGAACAVALALFLGACGRGVPAGNAGAENVIVSNRSGAWRLYALDPSAGTARLLGADPEDTSPHDDAQPARLPNGALVFARTSGGRPALFRTDPDGTHTRPLFARDPGASDSDPAPLDRERIVFARDDGQGARDLYAARLDGSEALRLTRHPADDGAPCALADGHTVVFVSRRTDRPRLFRLDANAPDPEATVAPLLPEGAAGGVAIQAESAPLCLADSAVVMALVLSGRPAQLFEFGTSKGRSGLRQITEAAILPYGAGEPAAAADGGILLTAGPLPEERGPRFSVYEIARGGYNLARVTRSNAGYDDRTRRLSAP
jgi:hypothetical protein